MFFNLCESHFVNWEVDLEKTVWRIRISVAEDFIGELGEDWMGFTVFEETAGNFAGLITAKQK